MTKGAIMVVVLAFGLSACTSVFGVMNSISGQHARIETGKPVAIIFIDIECPISQYTAKPFQELKEQHSESIEFIGIIPGDHYSDEKIDSFLTTLKLDYVLISDRKNKLVKRLGATITPEVFLLDRGENVIYQGALDDRYKALGRSRQEVSERYLEEAISAFLLRTPIELTKTDAIGCKIEL